MTTGLVQENGEDKPTKPDGSLGQNRPIPPGGGVVRADLTILNKLGLHARPAMQFSDVANQYAARVTVYKDEQAVDAKSIMDMLTLAAGQGTMLTLEAEGPDAAEAVTALSQLVARRFDEE